MHTPSVGHGARRRVLALLVIAATAVWWSAGPRVASAGSSASFGEAERVEYQRVDGESFDVVLAGPAGDEALPTAILVHGGGWSSGSVTNMDEIADLFGQHGWRTVTPEYRRTPHPAQRDDIVRVIDWTLRNGDRLGIDGHHVVLVGASSGGNVALLAAAERSSVVAAVISLSGPTDLEAMVSSGTEAGTVLRYVGCSREATVASCEALRAASPVTQVTEDFPATMQVFGTEERVGVDQAAALDDLLRSLGRPSEVRTVDGRLHGRNLFPVTADVIFAFVDESFANASAESERAAADAPSSTSGDTSIVWIWPLPALAVVAAVLVGLRRWRSDRRDS